MICSELYILFHEVVPRHFFTKSNEEARALSDFVSLEKELEACLEAITVENFEGYYDIENVEAFLRNYDSLDDWYPVSPREKLRQSLKGWSNWKEKRISDAVQSYTINGTPEQDNSFGEIYERLGNNSDNNYLVITNDSICFSNCNVRVMKPCIRGGREVQCRELKQVPRWFSQNRIPPRVYSPSPKHGENGRGEWKCNPPVSKLLCSHDEAEHMLHLAVGTIGSDELFYIDEIHDSFITFRYEGETPVKRYHAYHISKVNKRIETILSYVLDGDR